MVCAATNRLVMELMESAAMGWGEERRQQFEGVEICYRFANGPANSCPEPCKEGRNHACQICLGRRPNAQ